MLTILILILIALLGYTLFHQFNAFRQIQIRENHQRLFYATPVIIAIVFLEVGFEFGETFIQYALFILIAINFVAIPFTSGLSNDFIYYKSNKRGIAGFIPKSKALTDVIGSQHVHKKPGTRLASFMRINLRVNLRNCAPRP